MQIPNDLEVGYVPLSMGGAYPGLYLFTSPSRFVRPVRNISIPSNGDDNIELIGPFEQVNIDLLVHHIIVWKELWKCIFMENSTFNCRSVNF